MNIAATNATAAAGAAGVATTGRDYASLGQSDFLRLLTVQVQQQDPFDPVDNKEMLAQMAQFSQLAGISEVNSTLKLIAEKLGVSTASPGTPGQSEAPTPTPADNQE